MDVWVTYPVIGFNDIKAAGGAGNSGVSIKPGTKTVIHDRKPGVEKPVTRQKI